MTATGFDDRDRKGGTTMTTWHSFASAVWTWFAAMALSRSRAMSLSLLEFVGQASLVDDAMLPS